MLLQTPDPRFLWAPLAALLLAAPAVACAANPSPAAIPEGANCATPLSTVVIIDDLAGAPAWMPDAVRRFRLTTPSQALRGQVERDGCFSVLESDLIFASVPGAVQPDLILRARIVELKTAEKNLGEKASTAVERYIGSYLGTMDQDVAALGSVAIAVDVLCPKSRRRVAEIKTQASAPESRSARQNDEVLLQAFGEAARDVAAMIRQRPRSCEPSP